MVTSLTSPWSTWAMNSLKLGSSSRAAWPLADTSFQSITPRSTIESQNKMVFAVELGFTFYLSNWVPETRSRNTRQSPLQALPIRRRNPLCRQAACVSTNARAIGQTVADPHLIRCGLEAEVIGLQVHAAALRFVQQDGQPQRARPALRQTPQQKFLRDAAVQNGIHEQNVAPLQFGTRTTEEYLASCVLAFADILYLLAYEVANQRCSNPANQIRSENETAVHSNHYVDTTALVRAGDLLAHGGHARGNSCFGKRRRLFSAQV